MAKENQLIFRLILSFYVALFLSSTAACSLLPSASPTSTPQPLSAWTKKWLTHPSCQPPCWEGITPGVSTITDTLQIVRSMPGIKDLNGPLQYPNSNAQEVKWHFIDTLNEGGRAISDNEGHFLKSIALGFNKSLTLADVLPVYGPPSKLVFSDCRGDPIGSVCTIQLIYLSSGMLLNLYLPATHERENTFTAKITPDTEVHTIWFFPPGLEGYNSSFFPPIDQPDRLMNWNGYSTYTYDLSVH
jgi:hypothetical protein